MYTQPPPPLGDDGRPLSKPGWPAPFQEVYIPESARTEPPPAELTREPTQAEILALQRGVAEKAQVVMAGPVRRPLGSVDEDEEGSSSSSSGGSSGSGSSSDSSSTEYSYDESSDEG